MTTFTRCVACACSFIAKPRTGMGVDEHECPCCRTRHDAKDADLAALRERLAAAERERDEAREDRDAACAKETALRAEALAHMDVAREQRALVRELAAVAKAAKRVVSWDGSGWDTILFNALAALSDAARKEIEP